MNNELLIELKQKQSGLEPREKELSLQMASKKQNEKITAVVIIVSILCIPLEGVTLLSLVGGIVFWFINKKSLEKLTVEYNSLMAEMEKNKSEIIKAEHT